MKVSELLDNIFFGGADKEFLPLIKNFAGDDYAEIFGINDDYIRLDIHDFLLKCVEGHCNILVSGETGSGKTEFIKYLLSARNSSAHFTNIH